MRSYVQSTPIDFSTARRQVFPMTSSFDAVRSLSGFLSSAESLQGSS